MDIKPSCRATRPLLAGVEDLSDARRQALHLPRHATDDRPGIRSGPAGGRCAGVHDLSEVVMHIGEPQCAVQGQWMTDRLISIRDIRALIGLGRTAAYELTHRPGFPEPVVISPRCYRWWASEVTAFATGIRREAARPRRHSNASRARERYTAHPNASACRISGKVRVARARRQSS